MSSGARWVAMVVAVVLAVGCTSGGEPSVEPIPATVEPSTTSTVAASSTTTTTEATTTTPVPPGQSQVFEPLPADPNLSVRDQVEAAYLHHWDVLMEAYRTGDTSMLPLVYTDRALTARVEEINDNSAEGFRVAGHVEHNYAITVFSEDEATVMDGYRNYLVRADPVTGEPSGVGSGGERLHEYGMRKVDGRWLVFRTVRHALN